MKFLSGLPAHWLTPSQGHIWSVNASPLALRCSFNFEWTKSSVLPYFSKEYSLYFVAHLFVALFWSSSSRCMHFSASVTSAVTQKCWVQQQKSLVLHGLLECNCACRIPRGILLTMAFDASDKKELCYFALMLCAVAIHTYFSGQLLRTLTAYKSLNNKLWVVNIITKVHQFKEASVSISH